MEQIISEITASQGLSAVAVIALFAILLLIISAFIINNAISEINFLRSQVNDYMNANTERFDLLSASHKELNLKIYDCNRRIDILFDETKAVKEKHELQDGILRNIIETQTQANKDFKQAIQNQKEIGSKPSPYVPSISKDIFEEFQQKLKNIKTSSKRPKFKIGDKVKTNTGNFVGKVVLIFSDKNSIKYNVENKKEFRTFSESTLRHA